MGDKRKTERRAELTTRFGNEPETVKTIDEILSIDQEIAGTKRGQSNTKLERRRERRLWMERRDDLISKLDARLKEMQPEPLKATAMERRFPGVPVKVLVNAARVHLTEIERLTSYSDVEYQESLLDKAYGPDWLEAFRELLERYCPEWLRTFESEADERDLDRCFPQQGAEPER